MPDHKKLYFEFKKRGMTYPNFFLALIFKLKFEFALLSKACGSGRQSWKFDKTRRSYPMPTISRTMKNATQFTPKFKEKNQQNAPRQ
jgi:hypothetical protein